MLIDFFLQSVDRFICSKSALVSSKVGGYGWLATPTGCRLVVFPQPSESSQPMEADSGNSSKSVSWMENPRQVSCDENSFGLMYQSKIAEMMNYFWRCYCFKGNIMRGSQNINHPLMFKRRIRKIIF